MLSANPNAVAALSAVLGGYGFDDAVSGAKLRRCNLTP